MGRAKAIAAAAASAAMQERREGVNHSHLLPLFLFSVYGVLSHFPLFPFFLFFPEIIPSVGECIMWLFFRVPPLLGTFYFFNGMLIGGAWI
jgi:hypothetical protein